MRIYRYSDLVGLGISYSRQWLGRLERAGKFPKRFKLMEGANLQGATGWNADAVDEHLRKREAAPQPTYLSVKEQHNARATG